MSRTVAWFSAGAASAVATKLTLGEGECVIAYDTSADEPGSLGENDWRL